MATKTKRRIIGIDPGTNFLGYAIIEVIGREIKLEDCDVLKINKGFTGKAIYYIQEDLLSHRATSTADIGY